MTLSKLVDYGIGVKTSTYTKYLYYLLGYEQDGWFMCLTAFGVN